MSLMPALFGWEALKAQTASQLMILSLEDTRVRLRSAQPLGEEKPWPRI